MKRRDLLVVASVLLFGATACVPLVPVAPKPQHGPPAHAPAHGHRKKMHGHELSFDTGVGVYVVVGSPGLYVWDDFYWRLRDGIWLRAVAFDGPWLIVEDPHRHLPPGLAKKHGYGKSGKGKEKSKEKGKGKPEKDD